MSQEFSQIPPDELGEQRAASILTNALHQVLDESRVQQQSLVHVDTLQMPRCELQTFNGDPAEILAIHCSVQEYYRLEIDRLREETYLSDAVLHWEN